MSAFRMAAVEMRSNVAAASASPSMARGCCHPGDSIASAFSPRDHAGGSLLQAASASRHLHRRTGRANALVTVARVPGRRQSPATLVRVEDGMTVTEPEPLASLKHDIRGAHQLFERFLGAGFYYKTFMGPGGLWEKLYEPAIRKAAGLGEAPRLPDPDRYETVHHHCDQTRHRRGRGRMERSRPSKGRCHPLR